MLLIIPSTVLIVVLAVLKIGLVGVCQASGLTTMSSPEDLGAVGGSDNDNNDCQEVPKNMDLEAC